MIYMKCSGVNISSFRYRLYDDYIMPLDWSDVIISSEITKGNSDRPIIVEFCFAINCMEGVENLVQVEILDLSGNIACEEWTVRIDGGPPVIEIVSYEILSSNETNVLRAEIQVVDDISGVNVSTLIVGDTFLSEINWLDIPVEGSGYLLSFTIEIEMTYGKHKICLLIEDMAGNIGVSETYIFNILPPHVNQPPKPRISYPKDGERFFEGELVKLNAMGTGDDGMGSFNPVHLTWFSNISGQIGMGFDLGFIPQSGLHRITLYADDGEYNVSISVDIEVISFSDESYIKGPDEPEDGTEDDYFTWILVGGAGLAVLIAVTIMVIISKRGDEG